MNLEFQSCPVLHRFQKGKYKFNVLSECFLMTTFTFIFFIYVSEEYIQYQWKRTSNHGRTWKGNMFSSQNSLTPFQPKYIDWLLKVRQLQSWWRQTAINSRFFFRTRNKNPQVSRKVLLQKQPWWNSLRPAKGASVIRLKCCAGQKVADRQLCLENSLSAIWACSWWGVWGSSQLPLNQQTETFSSHKVLFHPVQLEGRKLNTEIERRRGAQEIL